jgi:tRNA-dihydrouridine synthase 4
LESAGCSYLTVHGRTINERHDPVHVDFIKAIKENIKSIPIVANGDIFSLEDCYNIKKITSILIITNISFLY